MSNCLFNAEGYGKWKACTLSLLAFVEYRSILLTVRFNIFRQFKASMNKQNMVLASTDFKNCLRRCRIEDICLICKLGEWLGLDKNRKIILENVKAMCEHKFNVQQTNFYIFLSVILNVISKLVWRFLVPLHKKGPLKMKKCWGITLSSTLGKFC